MLDNKGLIEKFEVGHPVVMALYKDVSNARCFDGN